MDTARSMSSKRNTDRPMTESRPATSMRPMTTTGLQAPKTSRGKTALQRQVQDKSYWIGVLKTKMNELTAEIAVMSRENEEMALEENRMGLLKKKAESLAKELAAGNLSLSIHNEFLDRQRIGDTLDDVKEDMEATKTENEDLAASLETGYEEQKKLEALLSSYEKRKEESRTAWNHVLARFSVQENSELEKIEGEAAELSRSMQALESEVSKLGEKRQQLEASAGSGPDSFLKKEIVQSMERLRSLEKQRDGLTDGASNSDERGLLLAQIKRDNKEVAAMETRVAEVSAEIEETKAELEAYEDTEATEKYRELRKKEQAMDAFLSEFDQTKRDEVNKIREMGSEVSSVLDRITRMITHIDGLKQAEPTGRGSGLDRLMDDKRRLELDLSKIGQLEVKIQAELESLASKIKRLESDVAKYSDIDELEKEMDRKSESLKSERDELKERTMELRGTVADLDESLSGLRKSLEKNALFAKTKGLESRLTAVLSTNERIRSAISEIDDSFLKQRVLDQAKRHNQRLQGF